ncbi:hypothetical protein NDU88_008496, partial [Pleurodeles waltl]
LQQLVALGRRFEGLQFPDLIVIHLGGNDLVRMGRKALREAIFLEITKLAKQYPNAAIAWSHMVPCASEAQELNHEQSKSRCVDSLQKWPDYSRARGNYGTF